MDHGWTLEMSYRELIPEYKGNTYVGYLDISGFKQMMSDDSRKAEDVLEGFYSIIYANVRCSNSDDSSIKFNAVVVSDCAVLFLSPHGAREGDVDQIEGLSKILAYVRNMNRAFISHSKPFMATCSIAYGDFYYQNRKEIDRITKNCIRGQAYMDAFSDSESNEPRMQPSECRILKTIPKRTLRNALPNNPAFSYLKPKGRHYYFYWMLQDKRNIKKYETEYKQAKEMMYERLIQLVKDSCE